MENIQLDIRKATQFLNAGVVEGYESKVKEAQKALENATCPGNDFLGWLHLPSEITEEFLNSVQAVANTLREKCEVVVVAGIGGSYLGARAVIEALSNSFAWLVGDKKNPVILFAGNNIGEDYLAELTAYLKGKKFGVINISKSGTTTETALTFRLLKKQCEEQMGKEAAKDVIVAITDGDRLLLTKYAPSHSSHRQYALVAGYTEVGETLEQTVHREVMEEVGLKVKNLRYYKSQPWSFSGSLLAGFYCDVDGDPSITLDREELSVAEWFDRDSLPEPPNLISLTGEMIECFRQGKEPK